MIGERRVLVLRGHTDDLTDVAFSPDSRLLLTTSRDHTARVWEVASGQTLHVLEQGGDVVVLDISRDGATAATGSEDGQIWLWALATGEPARPEPFQAEGAVLDVDFSPDGILLVAASTDGTAWIWHLPSGQHARLTGHDTAVSAAAFSPDGRYLATVSGDKVHLWDMDGLKPIELKQARHGAGITRLAFSPNGKFLATSSQDQTARLWDLRRLDADPLVLRGHTETVWRVLFSPDGRLLVTTSWDDTARLWRVDDGALDAVLTGHSAEVWNPAFSPDGSLLATPDESGDVRLWRAWAGGDIARHSVRAAPTLALATLGAQIAVAGAGGDVEVWDPTAGSATGYTLGDTRWVAVAASPDRAHLAVGGADGGITVLDAATGITETTWSAHANGVHALLFMPDGARLASAGGDALIQMWNLSTGQPPREGGGQPAMTLRGHRNDVNALALGPAETLISASGDGTVQFWNLQTGEAQTVFDAGQPLLAVAYSPEKRTLAAGGRGSAVYVWDLAARDPKPSLLPHDAAVRALAFSPRGNLLATGDEDGTIRLWDVARREAVTLRGHAPLWVTGLAFSSDGKTLFSGGGDGLVYAWPAQTPDLLAFACQRAGRDLTETEWAEVMPLIPFNPLCQATTFAVWAESQQLDPPRPLVSPDPPAVDERPTIRYFEAVPGSLVRVGESVTLRWDGAGASEVYLEYGGERHGVTAPKEERFSPTEDTLYRLIAVNAAGERALTLTISVYK